jgi:DNA-binding transcriptional LysR family regulator
MQNRRIIDAVFESLEIKAMPPIVSNSFLGVCSYLRHGGFASIVPHTFFYVFADSRDLVGIDLVEPMHGQVIGLVMTDRDPLPPMANALIAATGGADLEDGLAAAVRGKVDQAFLSIVQKISLDKDRV